MTLSEITESVHVDATPDEVWAVVTDVRRHTEFAGPKSITKEIEFEGPLEVGTRWMAHEKFGPSSFDAPSEVTAVDRGHDFGWVSFPPMKEEKRGAGGRAYWDYHLEPEDGGTRLSHHMRVEEPAKGALSLKAMYKVLNLPKKQRAAILTTLGNVKEAAERQHLGR
ncbi:SRPBCC family protein [Streptomyces sp. NPDC091371]|uniref:SRPBCC family protein n=1 Tax=Streptomyces sp. NPDC091371 TaxID=3155303 RepID=UPI0034428FF1